MSDVKHIFVSYSERRTGPEPKVVDNDRWCEAVARHLRSLNSRERRVSVWVDRDHIGPGDDWNDEIESAMNAADVAVLLVSPQFLASDFVREVELPRLLERHRQGLRLVPILVAPCSWESHKWLHALEVRPHGGPALSELGVESSPPVDRALAGLMKEIAAILDRQPPGSGVGPPEDDVRAVATAKSLLGATLLDELPQSDRDPLAAHVVDALGRFCGISGEALFNAVRLFIEYQLLRSKAPTSPHVLRAVADGFARSETARRLAVELRRGVQSGHFAGSVIDVSPRFFMLAREREDAWQRYFDALRRIGCSEAATLACVRVSQGFIAPQFLVAGLLSRFDDDWRPVLDAYEHSIPPLRSRSALFGSLQASQWNCWLVWGPSIPICACSQWQGEVAYQYGYGDENNSLPLLEPADDAAAPVLAPLVATLADEGRSAKPLALVARLRWAPHFLGGPAEVGPVPRHDDELDDGDESGHRAEVGVHASRRPLALAQANLCRAQAEHTQHSDGLVLQREHAEPPADDARVYFSAYLWMMFLVALATPDADTPDAGPQRLRRQTYPPLPRRPAQRVRVRDAHLWEDLLPVFVHGNIADPAALQFQRPVLVDNALHLLRHVWNERAECFDADDVAKGIRFHLVCSSDYSGCDGEIRHPPQHPLPELLRRRLIDEPDRDFAEAVVVPDAGTTPRPWALARYFSSCHLPELVADYYSFIGQIQRHSGKGGG